MLGIQTNLTRATDHRNNAAILRGIRDDRRAPAHLADAARWHELRASWQVGVAVLKVAGWLAFVSVGWWLLGVV